VVPVREALKLLAHENLVIITPRHGPVRADVNIPDLGAAQRDAPGAGGPQRAAAPQRATADDITVLGGAAP